LGAVVRSLDRDAGLLGEFFAEEVHELLVEFVSSEVRVGNGCERVEETVSDGDDGCGGGGSSDIENDGVAVDREGFAFSRDFSRLVGGESGSRFGDSLNDVDAGLFGGSEEGVGLSRGEGSGDGEDGVGYWSTEEIGSVRKENSEESDDAVVDSEGGGFVVD
jgi:hypothetical protein